MTTLTKTTYFTNMAQLASNCSILPPERLRGGDRREPGQETTSLRPQVVPIDFVEEDAGTTGRLDGRAPEAVEQIYFDIHPPGRQLHS